MTIAKTRREREVWEACDAAWEEMQLADESIEKLTGDRIRSKLQILGYARGNQNQIYAYRQTWKLSMGFDDEAPETNQKQQLEARIQQVVSYVMKALDEEAQTKIEEIRAEYLEKADKIQLSNDVLKNELGVLTEKYNELVINHDNLNKRHLQVTDEHGDVKTALKIADEKIIALTNQLHETKLTYEIEKKELNQSFEKQVSKFEQQLSAKELQYKDAEDSLREANEKDRQNWMLELDKSKQKAQGLNEKYLLCQSKLNTTEKNHESLKLVMKKQKEKFISERKLDARQNNKLSDELQTSKSTIAKLEGLVDSGNQQITYLQNQVGELQKMLSELKVVNEECEEAAK